MPQTPKVKLVLVDDQTLFRKGLLSLIEMVSDNYSILFEADNGKDFSAKSIKKISPILYLWTFICPAWMVLKPFNG